MKSAKVSILLMLHLYSIAYGVFLLFSLHHFFTSAIYSLFVLGNAMDIAMRLFKVLNVLATNIYYSLALTILIFLEVLRLAITRAKILTLLEAFLLLIYTWSIEIFLLYVGLSYILVKLLEGFVSEHGQVTRLLCSAKTIAVDQVEVKRNTLTLFALGLSVLLHVTYSFIVHVNVATIILYLVIETICVLGSYEKYVSIGEAIEIALVSVPPFGVLIPIFRGYTRRCLGPKIEAQARCQVE